jgi:hypothetical protein
MLVVLDQADASANLALAGLAAPPATAGWRRGATPGPARSACLVAAGSGCDPAGPAALAAARRTCCCPPASCPAAPTAASPSGWRCCRRHRPRAPADRADVGVPADTARGWLRRARQQAPWLGALATRLAYQTDPELGAIWPRRSALAEAVEALGQAAAALTRWPGLLASSPWHLIVAFTRGRLLAPHPSD